MNEPMGMLMAMMQPPADMEEEFQDWYDTEHIPERAAITGFLSAQRFVCLDGFPKYIAAYDLTHHGVLQEPEYQAVAGTNFSRGSTDSAGWKGRRSIPAARDMAIPASRRAAPSYGCAVWNPTAKRPSSRVCAPVSKATTTFCRSGSGARTIMATTRSSAWSRAISRSI